MKTKTHSVDFNTLLPFSVIHLQLPVTYYLFGRSRPLYSAPCGWNKR